MKTMKINSCFLLLLITLFCYNWAHNLTDDSHICKHDEQEFNPEVADIESELLPQDPSGRFLQSSSYPNLRIYPYYDSITNVTTEFSDYINKELIPPIISLFQLAIRIKYPTKGKLVLNQTAICGVPTPSAIKT